MIDLTQKIGKYLTLKEICKSNTAIKNGIDNTPNEAELKHIQHWVLNIYDPLCDYFGIKIPFTCMFRNKATNKAVGGSSTSEHQLGCAGDLDADGTKITNQQIFDYTRAHLPFTEIINEFNCSWIHISCNYLRKDKEIMKAVKVNGKTQYQKVI